MLISFQLVSTFIERYVWLNSILDLVERKGEFTPIASATLFAGFRSPRGK